ncbi:MAG: hypothetical protein JO043_07625 [Candidatus Eremiobacteraeota bacterium]|nr:hypothetical protein [Candidatus Eremiobacteraeota bacterium]
MIGPLAIFVAAALGTAPVIASAIVRHETLRSMAASASKGVLLLANASGGVLIYSSDIREKNPPLLGTITTGAPRPTGVWVDRHQTLYVVNDDFPNSSISEYKHGSMKPFRTITAGLSSPQHVAVGNDGTVYVDDIGIGTIVLTVYAPGSTTPTQTVNVEAQSGGHQAGGLAFDPNGNLLVATFTEDFGGQGEVFRIDPKTFTVSNLNLQSDQGPAIGTDAAGNLYVAQKHVSPHQILVYPPGKTTPSRSLFNHGYVFGMTVSHNGTVYAPTFQLVTSEFAPGATQPTNEFDPQGGVVDAALASSW